MLNFEQYLPLGAYYKVFLQDREFQPFQTRQFYRSIAPFLPLRKPEASHRRETRDDPTFGLLQVLLLLLTTDTCAASGIRL
jgi:hypothetical protein